jgi:hypothetical protein
MANIEIDKIRLIVEKNMRDLGLGEGKLEVGWKKAIPLPDGTAISQDLNLQTLRDIISLSIFDILTNTNPVGTYSVDNTKGSQTLNHVSSDINIFGPNVVISNSSGNTHLAARNGDPVAITDSKFLSIWTAFIKEIQPKGPLFTIWPYLPLTSSAVLAAYPAPIIGTISPSGIITSGSSIVKIG